MTTPDSTPLTGQQISAAAYALPPLELHGLSLAILVVSALLAIFTVAIAGLRIWVRLGLISGLTRVWKIEDYLLVLSLVSNLGVARQTFRSFVLA